MAEGAPHLVNVAKLALWTMQRQNDILAMTPLAYALSMIRNCLNESSKPRPSLSKPGFPVKSQPMETSAPDT